MQELDNKYKELPLQQLFTRLQEAGLTLGIDEYHLLLQSLQAGFGIADKVALKRLCQTLWVKSAEEKSILEYHFEQVIPSDLVTPVSEKKSKNINQPRLRQIYRIAPYVILGLAGVGIALIVKLPIPPIQSSKPIPTTTLTPLTPTTTPTPPTPTTTPTTTSTPPTPIATPTPPTSTPPTPIPRPISVTQQTNWIVWMFIFLSTITSEYLLFNWMSNWLSKLKVEPTPSYNTSAPASELAQTNENELQVVKSVFQVTNSHLNSRFFPVTQRQMKQMWRYLRHPIREGKATELDIEETVNQIGQQALFLELVLVPPRVNRAQLLILIDQDGSMTPFHLFSHGLADTALRGGRLGRTGIYYFHNYPIEYLYRDRYHQEAELVSDILSHRCSERTAVLIFSDAGAARGGYSEERYELTQEFLTQLKQRVRHIAWLNPIPRKRWFGTTAGKIACFVPMFELSRPGLQDAISVLRGRPTNLEKWRK